MDIFPTILDILGVSTDYMLQPVDGISIKSLIQNKKTEVRKKAIPFIFQGKGALVDNEFKLVATNIKKGTFELFNLEQDKTESTDVSKQNPEKFEQLKTEFHKWYESVKKSIDGMDYPERKVNEGEPESHFWVDDPRYEMFIEKYGTRPEYSGVVKQKKTKNKTN